MIRKSKFVSLSQLASKATGGAYGGHAPTLPPSSSAGPSPSTPTHGGPHTPGGSRDTTMEKKRMTWADRVREKLPPLDANEYEVLWERGVLGVIFLESEKDGIPYVSKATESCISPLVQPGDILKFVNDVRSEKHSFSEFFKILATMKKPVLLRFERPAVAGGPASLPRTPSPEGLAREPPAPAIGEQRSISTNDIGGSGAASRATAMKDAAKALAAKVHRSNSLPQSDKQQAMTPSPMQQKPVARGTFWRASTAKELATPQQQHLQATPKILGGMPATPKTPKRRDMQSPVAKQKYDGDTDTSDSPNEPWDEDDRANDDEYQHIEVYWETGSLGLFFGEERGTGYPVVTRSTPGVNPSVHRKVQVNDVLLAANGVRSADFTFEAFFARLQQMSKPVKLVFKRKVVGPGTPPPQSRTTSFPTESPQSVAPPVPARTPSPVPQPKTTTVETVPVTPTPSRPTRLPLPSPTSETSGSDMRHTTATAVTRQSNGFLRQDPSPSSSKPRSTSVETRSLMEDEHSPIAGDSNTLRGKSPSSRPDIVFLGSPQKKPRGPPPSPPANLALDSAPSPREKIEKKPPTPSSQTTSSYAPSPRDKRPSPSPRPEQSRPDVLVLGDDFGVSPREKFKAVELTEGEIVEEDVEEAAADGLVIEEGVAVGVPLDSSVVAEEGLHVESAEVADAVLAVAVEDVERVSSKASISSSVVSSEKLSVEVGLPVSEPTSEGLSGVDDETDREDSDDSSSQSGTESESDEGEPLDAMVQDDPDISGDLDSNEILTNDPKGRGSISSPSKPNKAAMNASLAKYKKKSKNSRPMVKLPAINEDASQTVPLAAPNAVNTNVQVRGRTKPKPSLVETPDSSTYLVKWKEGRSVGLQLREVRMAKGTFPLVVDVCKDPCCDVLKHVCIGDVIVEINGRNCSTMGVKKTVNFLKTSSKTMLLKLRRGPAFLNERVSAYA